MQRIKNIKKAWFAGIGGIGMSALARYFLAQGIRVGGYDRVRSSLTDELEREGAFVTDDASSNSIWKAADLVVYTPALPANHAHLQWARDHDVSLRKRSEVLGAITRDAYTVAVAGTHGKTSISTLLTFLLREGGIGAGAFLGGIARNYESNFLPPKENILIVEADEYDRSFHRLHPDMAIITAIDPDHLDVYGNYENLKKAYTDFALRLPADGRLFMKSNIEMDLPGRQIEYYQLEGDSGYRARNIRSEAGRFVFDFCRPDGECIEGLVLHFPGFHNVENAVVAIAAALQLGVSEESIRENLPRFKGIARRFEYWIQEEDMVMIDDYAHHPAEIEKLLSSVRAMYPGKRISVVFQPHLYSRTRDLASEFAAALSIADDVILLPVYPAREEPIAGVSSDLIGRQIEGANVQIREKSDLIDTLGRLQTEVLLTVGAGDIDRLLPAIKDKLIKRKS